MISVDEIDRTILELEQKDTSYAVCEKLSWLYICRDHLRTMQTPETRMVNLNKATSAFLEAANKKPIEKVLEIVNDHMDIIKILYPKEYDEIIARINES